MDTKVVSNIKKLCIILIGRSKGGIKSHDDLLLFYRPFKSQTLPVIITGVPTSNTGEN